MCLNQSSWGPGCSPLGAFAGCQQSSSRPPPSPSTMTKRTKTSAAWDTFRDLLDIANRLNLPVAGPGVTAAVAVIEMFEVSYERILAPCSRLQYWHQASEQAREACRQLLDEVYDLSRSIIDLRDVIGPSGFHQSSPAAQLTKRSIAQLQACVSSSIIRLFLLICDAAS